MTDYLLGDALGSVRQWTDSNGNLTLSKAYNPYGEVTQSAGAGQSSYGYTSEYQDGHNDLLYLRARHYAPGMGRFLSRDTWAGDYNRPGSLNRWAYAEANPVNWTDPSGLCIAPSCFFTLGSASTVVAKAKVAYSKVGPILLTLSQKDPFNSRFNCLNSRWTKPDTTIDLLADYFCERGPVLVDFSGRDALTLELSRSVLLDSEIRQKFYAGALKPRGEMRFNIPQFLTALQDAFDSSTGKVSFPLTHFLGSFDYKVTLSASGRVQYEISNRTDLSSGTHIPLRFPPEEERDNPYSLEQFIKEHPLLAGVEASFILMTNPRIVSILQIRTREETPFLMGGGRMFQTFKWSERFLGCGLESLPLSARYPLLDAR